MYGLLEITVEDLEVNLLDPVMETLRLWKINSVKHKQ